MLLVNAVNLSFKYPGQIENIFESIDLSIYQNQKIGLIGLNGSGKSTLLDILRGNIKADKGTLHCSPKIKIKYLPQEIRDEDGGNVEQYLWSANPKLADLKNKINQIQDWTKPENLEMYSDFENLEGYKFQVEIEKIITKFDILPQTLNKPLKILSGGEKTKLGLARILLTKPDLLLLDEPTNNLDLETLTWLEKFLNNCSNSYVVVSHDRKFLNNCVDQIWELNQKKIMGYSGNYNFYKQQKELEFLHQVDKRQQLNQKIKQLKNVYQQKIHKVKSYESFKQERSVSKTGAICKRDAGSGSSRLKTKKMAQSAQAVKTKLEKLHDEIASVNPEKNKKTKISFIQPHNKSKFVLKVENLSKSFEGKKIFQDLNFAVKTGLNFQITGKNGSGKSTLLKILTGYISDFQGTYLWNAQVDIGYYSQNHHNLELTKSALAEVTGGVRSAENKARILLGCFNLTGDKVFKTVEKLSVGERSKVLLAKIILSPANVLILDEPVNHLEITAREALEKALINYSGTIIFVSHDRYFSEKLSPSIFCLD
ncbi:MAG: hypothetical protein APR63_11900 [Desulfuromonas sp. SDB]|nr:MAG: hypothetical protein APR63_11900 [Desulfuromonas sp. SDB]